MWAQNEEHLEALRAAAPRSAMTVPLLAHGELLGAMGFLSSSRTYDESDLAAQLATFDDAVAYLRARMS